MFSVVHYKEVSHHLVVHFSHDASEDDVQGALLGPVLALELPGAVGKLVVLSVAVGIGGYCHHV